MPASATAPLHRLHPRTMMALVGASFFVGYADLWPWRGVPLAPWVGLGLLGALAAWDGAATAGRWLRRTALLLAPFALSYLVMQGFFAPHGGRALFHLGPFPFAEAGLYEALRFLGRVALPLGAMLLLLTVVEVADALRALEEIGMPHELSYVLLAAVALLPGMAARARRIQEAQAARGLRTTGPPWVRLRALLPLVGPLVSGALHEAEARAMALDARGFRSPGPRTPWRELRDSARQRWARRALLIGAALLFVAARLA